MAAANTSQVLSTAVLSSLAPVCGDVRLLARAEAAYQRAIQHDAAHKHDMNDLLTAEQELWARLADPVSHQAL